MEKPRKVSPFISDEPKDHDLKKENREEFWDRECLFEPDREECRVYDV